MQVAAVFFVTLFGIWNVVRITRQFRSENIIEEVQLTKIVAAYLAWILLCVLVVGRNSPIFVVSTAFPSIALLALPPWLRVTRIQKRRTEALSIVRQVIIKMKIGNSFHHALKSAVKSCSTSSRPYIQQIVDLVLLDPNRSPQNYDVLTSRLFQTWKRCHLEPHVAGALLEGLRYSLELEEKFERRMDVATQQTRAQAFTALIMFSLLCAWVHFQFGIDRFIGEFSIALVLSATGFFLVLNSGRKIKWQV